MRKQLLHALVDDGPIEALVIKQSDGFSSLRRLNQLTSLQSLRLLFPFGSERNLRCTTLPNLDNLTNLCTLSLECIPALPPRLPVGRLRHLRADTFLSSGDQRMPREIMFMTRLAILTMACYPLHCQGIDLTHLTCLTEIRLEVVADTPPLLPPSVRKVSVKLKHAQPFPLYRHKRLMEIGWPAIEFQWTHLWYGWPPLRPDRKGGDLLRQKAFYRQRTPVNGPPSLKECAARAVVKYIH